MYTAEEVGAAFKSMMEAVTQFSPNAVIDGVLIQQMVPKGTELILGMKRDAQFGPLVAFGLGGIYVEVLKDVTFRLAPIREFGAHRMIESIRSNKILHGFRGQAPADIPALVECIQRLSQLVVEIEAIDELDINPLTNLSGNRSSVQMMETALKSDHPYAICCIDIKNLHIYNEAYGVHRGDFVIRETANVIKQVVSKYGTKESFIGHLGGDDFVVVTRPTKAAALGAKICALFDSEVRGAVYRKEDIQNGYTLQLDRRRMAETGEKITRKIGSSFTLIFYPTGRSA